MTMMIQLHRRLPTHGAGQQLEVKPLPRARIATSAGVIRANLTSLGDIDCNMIQDICNGFVIQTNLRWRTRDMACLRRYGA
ncbi:MAG: hypothetical protein U1E64_05715 [Sphingomonadaceae bacterium]